MVANFVTFPWEGGNSRFTYLLDKIDCENNEVEFITSNFYHEKKKHRRLNEEKIKKNSYKITLIVEPGYKKNIALKRFYSHYKLGKNLKKYLNKLEEKPDIVYCAIPSLDVGKVCAQYCKKNKIRFIIDIQDLWPEAYKMIFDIPIISNLIFYPMKKSADYIYSNADEIVAVSETYCNRALKVNKKIDKVLTVFLGTDLKYFDECAKKNKVVFNDDLIRIAYIGTLGHSYDIKCIIDAIKILNDKGIKNLKFMVMGDGPLKQSFENYAKEKNVDCEFTGRLEYEKMVGLLCACDIAVNPIKSGSAGSIINKVGDYAMAGLPVINTQESEEYRKLVEEYKIGFNCKNGDIEDLAKKIKFLIDDGKSRKEYGINNRKLAEKKFDRNINYNEIVKLIKGE